MVKEYLSQKGIGYQEIDVSRDPAAAQELVNRTGRRAVPVTVIDGQTIIGFNRAQLEQALATVQVAPTFGASVADAGKITERQGSWVAGAYVGKVRAGSVAEEMGLMAGDIIIEMNRLHIASASDLEGALSRLQKGSRIVLVFLRGTQTLTAEGTL